MNKVKLCIDYLGFAVSVLMLPICLKWCEVKLGVAEIVTLVIWIINMVSFACGVARLSIIEAS